MEHFGEQDIYPWMDGLQFYNRLKMKHIIRNFNFMLIILVFATGCSQKSSHKYEESPAGEVLYRLIGERAKEIQFYSIASDSLNPNKMVYEIKASNGILKVGGNTGVPNVKVRTLTSKRLVIV